MQFFELSGSLQETDIGRIEEDLQLQFPEDFRRHYLRFNGGWPEKEYYVWPQGGRTHIDCFASIKEEGYFSLEGTYKNLAILEAYLPGGIVPFAVDDGGNFFCISTRGKDFNAVCYFNNDHYDLTDKEKAMTLLDTSFSHFIEHLSD